MLDWLTAPSGFWPLTQNWTFWLFLIGYALGFGVPMCWMTLDLASDIWRKRRT